MLQSTKPIRNAFKRYRPNWQDAFCQQRWLARGVRSVQPLETDIDSPKSVLDNKSACDYLGLSQNDDMTLLKGEYAFEDKNGYLKSLNKKYESLLKSNKKTTTGNKKTTWFGNVRLDSDNVPSYHGQFEKNYDKINETFDSVAEHLEKNKVILKSLKKTYDPVKSTILFDIDEEIKQGKATSQSSLAQEKIKFKFSEELQKSYNLKKCENEKLDDWLSHQISKREKQPAKNAPKQEEEISPSEKMIQVKLEFENQTNSTETITAENYLKQIHSGKRIAHLQNEFDNVKNFIKKNEILDSKGFRILKNQVPDYSRLTNIEILEMLEKQILFNDCDIVAINKPYGISVHGGSSSSVSTSRVNSRFDSLIHLGYFLPELANRLGCEKLYTVHRIDRDTTGVLLLAKTQSKAKQMNELFLKHEIVKKYLCITKTVPDHNDGIIDIPIEMGNIVDRKGIKRERMVLCPEPMQEVKQEYYSSRTAKRAVTKFKVLSHWGNAALLEVFPETGIRHQIRVHLGFGLRCPILGDHKYSYVDLLAPQKLPSDILMALRVRQSKVRHVPMHLHAYVYMIPQAGTDGKNIFIKAPLPFHFRMNMSKLKLRL